MYRKELEAIIEELEKQLSDYEEIMGEMEKKIMRLEWEREDLLNDMENLKEAVKQAVA